ncbi:sulfonate ABC transporter substrate-binding protein [Mastigocladopsis repens]|uniref:sulfonate ABC transporter substrate-binding protein n=1 Tax=Mastigocladopsis repens TaxID=221287 RepID=UPI0002DCE8E8|nr:sulfonate ABC transporter substrate-binding protein [Mastigocladopsis repens]
MNLFILLKPLSNITSFLSQCIRVLKQNSVKFFALLFTVGLCLSLGFSGCTSNNVQSSTQSSTAQPIANTSSAAVKVVRLGFQKSAVLALVKQQGTLEKELSSSGVTVKWAEFPAGPPIMEALNAGSIDFGTVGEGPPVFAQSAGVPLVYVGNSSASPEGLGILVRNDSPIQTLADLKGKKVGFTKGSSAHFMLVQALASAGLQYTDIQPAYLSPADARAVFEQGKIDAWAIWDPFLAAAQRSGGARILRDSKGLASWREFYVTSREFANKNPELVKQVLDSIDKVGDWAKKNPRKVAEFLSPQMGIDVASLELAESRRKRYDVEPVNEEVIAEQQKVADTFLGQKLIPKQIKVADAIWKPKQ